MLMTHIKGSHLALGVAVFLATVAIFLFFVLSGDSEEEPTEWEALRLMQKRQNKQRENQKEMEEVLEEISAVTTMPIFSCFKIC